MKNIRTHPIFTNYGANEDGEIYNVRLERPVKGSINKMGQKIVGIGKTPKLVSRIVYECFNGPIEEGYQIDHIDNDRTNNKLSNLQKLTKSENCIKKYKVDGYKSDGRKMQKVEATEKDTDNKQIFRSLSGAGKVLNICAPSIWRVCEGVYFYATSKNDGKKYSFKYI